ncbi:class I adenylate-forming enzyme family protein [uncultured Jatrophihabitans sp.]|uniref:class I adenylate-forming enzyme family protein n=1 Tax=uncultured Jatrophihabitans sp. TaxID=1610747 RepID=UPI0035CABD55
MTAEFVVPIPRTDAYPYPLTGVARDAHGIAYFEDVPGSLVAMLRTHVDARPDAEAVVELGGRRVTYRQLWDAAERVAGGLRAHGVGRGDRVAIRYPAGVDWVLAFFGTVLAGGIAVAVNTRLAPPEVEFVLADCGALVDLAPGTPLPDGEPVSVGDLGPDDVAAFFYTSGTTGKPKGVPTTHRAFVSNARNMLTSLAMTGDVGPELRTLISVPLFHVTGCNSQLIVALYVGGAAVIMPALDLAGIVDALVSERVTFLVTVPAVYTLLMRHPSFADADVTGVRWVGYGGAPIAPSLVIELKKAFPNSGVSNGYGMTETASLMTVLPDADAVAHADSVGYAMPVVDLAIAPIGDDRTTGELLARGPNVMTAYWQRPEETAATVVDGWLHTGDIVRVDEDGRVHIVDRAKDIINRGGENVSSVEVEDTLASAPGVADAAVIAVPDEVMGEKVGAVLVGLDGVDPDVEAVLAHCRTRLADYKIPQFVSVVAGPLPRNAGGKLLKSRLRSDVAWGAPLR